MSEHAAAPLLRDRARDGPRRPLPAAAAAGVAAAALAGTAGGVYLSASSEHAPNPIGHALLTVVVCLSFVGTGLLAFRRPPYVRFGVLLAAVGFSALLGSLHDANDAVPYTIGVITANLVFAVLVHALVAFPKGRLASRSNRMLVLAAYTDVLLLQLIAILFDPLTRWHSDHPSNAALVTPRPALATGLEETEAAIAAALALAVVYVLTRRAQAATPAARRQLVPVLLGGKVALLFLSAGLVLAPLSSEAAVVGIGLGMIAALALPAAFLAIMLQGRLSRAAVGELLVELREPGDAPSLRDALRRALGDPSLELLRAGHEEGVYVDRRGAAVTLPGPGETQVATPIRHQGEAVGALVHDRSLRLRPELLDAVSAAAGFALANERALETLQRIERRNRALLDAIPDLMFRVRRDGTCLDVQAEDGHGLVLPADQQIGRNVREYLPSEVATAAVACIERALDTGAMSSFEYELEVRGEARTFESRMVPSGANEVVTIVRDFTEQRRAEAEQRRLAEEQAALRRVATLVAGDAPSELVFQAVTEEVCRALELREAVLERYDGNGSAIVVGRYGDALARDFDVGTVMPLESGLAVTRVLETGAPVRVDYTRLDGDVAARVRRIGFHTGVAVPIKVAGSPWGALISSLRKDESLPPETERRLSNFASLVGLGVASAHARNELAASRLRIVEASDDERRRIERNLHDGAQQRLVGLSVALRLAHAKLRSSPEEAEALLEEAAEELGQALTELRELAQGIHPAVLTERGLGAALQVLAARSPLPVRLEIGLPERLPEAVEAAAYYIAAEALANVVKHADAAAAVVRASDLDGRIVVEVSDDGKGSADLARGSGLRGLGDRAETLGGHLLVESAPGRGTVVRAELPVRSPVLSGRHGA